MTWRKIKLGEVLKRVKNLVEIENDKDYKLVTVKMHHKGVTLRNITKGSEISSKKMHSVRSGEFILSGIDARHGAFGIIPAELEGAVITNDFWCLEFDENIIDKHLFLKLTSTSFFDDLCKKASDGTTNRVRLQAEKFYNLEIDLPSVAEQKALIESFQKFENYNNQITTELSHQLELVRQLRQAFLREAMQGKLVSQDAADEPAVSLLEKIKAEKEKLIAEKKIKKDKPLPEIKPEEIPFEIPNNWTWCRLGEIITFGPTNGYSPKANSNEKGVKCLTLTATTSGYFKKEYFKFVDIEVKEDSSLWLNSGDILLQRGNSLDYVGIAALYEGISNEFIYPDLMIKIRASRFINQFFLHKCLVSPFNRVYFQSNAFGAQKTMPKINQGVVINTLIPLPPLAEQKRIVEKLEKLMKFCDELEANIRESKGQAESLLQVALKEALEPKEIMLD